MVGQSHLLTLMTQAAFSFESHRGFPSQAYLAPEFTCQCKPGQWVCPSHIEYPAIFIPNFGDGQSSWDTRSIGGTCKETEQPQAAYELLNAIPRRVNLELPAGPKLMSFSEPQDSPFLWLQNASSETLHLSGLLASSGIPISQTTVPSFNADYGEERLGGTQQQTRDIAMDIEHMDWDLPVGENNAQTFLYDEISTTFLFEAECCSPKPPFTSADPSSIVPSIPGFSPPRGQCLLQTQQFPIPQHGCALDGTAHVSTSPPIFDDGGGGLESLSISSAARISAENSTSPLEIRPLTKRLEAKASGDLGIKVEGAVRQPTAEPTTNKSTESIKKPSSPKPLSSVKFPPLSHISSKRPVTVPSGQRARPTRTAHKSSKKSVMISERGGGSEGTQHTIFLPVSGRVSKPVKNRLASKPESESCRISGTSRPQNPVLATSQRTLPETPGEPTKESPEEELKNKAEARVVSEELAAARQSKHSLRKSKTKRISTCLSPDPARKFICDVPGCEKRFRRSEHLKRHNRSLHTLEKPYACPEPECNKKFPRSDNLNQHVRVHQRNAAATSAALATAEVEILPDSPLSADGTILKNRSEIQKNSSSASLGGRKSGTLLNILQ